MRTMLRWMVSSSIVVLGGCPKPPEPDITTPPPGGDAVGTPISAPLTLPPGCEAGPGWLAIDACESDGVIYARGTVEKMGNPALASATAMNRARAALVKLGLGTPQADGSVELRESEVLDSFACGDAVYALARVRPTTPLASPPSACRVEALQAQAAPSADCPAWTRKGAWREGDAIIAVGIAAGVKNPAMAQNVAKNRASAEAQKLVAVSLKVSDAGVTAQSLGKLALVPGDVETAQCGETTFARVTLRPP